MMISQSGHHTPSKDCFSQSNVKDLLEVLALTLWTRPEDGQFGCWMCGGSKSYLLWPPAKMGC